MRYVQNQNYNTPQLLSEGRSQIHNFKFTQLESHESQIDTVMNRVNHHISNPSISFLVSSLMQIFLTLLLLTMISLLSSILVTQIDKLRQRYKMTQDMAGVQFLSICNSLFEISTNTISVVNLDQRNFQSLVDVGFSTIVGSAIVEFTIVLVVLRVFNGKDIQLDSKLVLRDIAFYSIGLSLQGLYLVNRFINLFEVVTIFLLWVSQLVYVGVQGQYEMENVSLYSLDLVEPKNELSKSNSSGYKDINNNNCDNNNDEKNQFVSIIQNIQSSQNDMIYNRLEKISNMFLPFDLIFSVFYQQSVKSKTTSKLLRVVLRGIQVILQLVFLVGTLQLYSQTIELMLDVLLRLSSKLRLNEQLVGLVVMNLGSNLPDLVNALTCVRNHVAATGLSAVFASQVHNLLLGTSLPYLVFEVLYYPRNIELQLSSIHILNYNVALVLLMTVILQLSNFKIKLIQASTIFLQFYSVQKLM